MECDVINDNDVMDAAACFTLADGRSSACESRDLSHMHTSSSFDPLQSTLAHRFRSAGGYTCVTLLSPDRDDLLPEPPEMLMAAAPPDNALRCMEPLLQTGSRKPISEHARRAAVNTDGVCSTCVAKHRHLQSQHAPRRQTNMASPDDVTEVGS